MPDHRVLAPGAKQTDVLRGELERLKKLFPDPDAGRDPLELLERDVSDLKIEAEAVLADPTADDGDRARIRFGIQQLLLRATGIDLMHESTLFAMHIAASKSAARAAPAPGATQSAAAPNWVDVTPLTMGERIKAWRAWLRRRGGIGTE